MIDSETLISIIKDNVKGLDDVSVIPLINLEEALKETISRINSGLIPDIYHWSEEKTLLAYNYKNYKKWAKSIIVAAKYYYTDEKYTEKQGTGKIARYTWRNNYQYIIDKLHESIDFLKKYLNTEIKYKVLSNYTSIPEKVLFNYSKLASIGKNSLLIHKSFGSYFVIGEAFTNIEVSFKKVIPLKKPDFSICGKCDKCIKACPTGAIVKDGVLNINRCVQFLSENLTYIPTEIREIWRDRLYGCTDCIDVCPYNKNLKTFGEKHNIGYVGSEFDLLEILKMDEKKWKNIFGNNQIGRRDRNAIIKNAIIAIGSIKLKKAKSILVKYLNNSNELIRLYTVWALIRINPPDLKKIIFNYFKKEKSNLIKKEFQNYLN